MNQGTGTVLLQIMEWMSQEPCLVDFGITY